MKIIRFILTVPASLFAVGLIYFLLFKLLFWALHLGSFWFLFLFFFIGSTFWKLFCFLSGAIMYLVSFISPNKYFSLILIGTISGLQCVYVLVKTWSFERPSGLFFTALSIGISLLLVELTIALIVGAFGAIDDD